MNKKVMLILNPVAGKGLSLNIILAIIDTFNKKNEEVTVFTTQHAGHATTLIQEHGNSYDCVVSIGGDGTLNETVNGAMLVENRPSICYVPGGTVNDFATTLGISNGVSQLKTRIFNEHTKRIDIGKFNDRYFTYVAAFGAFTTVSYQTPQHTKNALGRFAYFLEGVKSLASINTYKIRLEYDDQIIEDTFIYGAITNSKSVGGMKFKNILDAELNDGLFEGLLIRPPQNPIDLQSIVGAILGQTINEKFMYAFKASKVHITSLDEAVWTLDGEPGGAPRDITIENIPEALPFIIN